MTLRISTPLVVSVCRDFKIRLRRDVDLFTDEFTAENADFDPAMIVKGDVEGTVI